MIGDLQNLTDGLIIFSALDTEFEKPDFKNDALAGVRSNYFNSHCREQRDVTQVMIDGDSYALSYKMSVGEALLWKVSRNSRPYQSVKRLIDGIYSVLFYEENGIVSKRVYFDSAHNWVRTEYFDRERGSRLLCKLRPKVINGITAIVSERVSEALGLVSSVLFPSEKTGGRKCQALIYSNVGMLWYDSAFCPEELKNNASGAPARSGGFGFTGRSFEYDASVIPYDIDSADYLTSADIPSDNAPESFADTAAQGEYSAYERIEKILAEAHKSNKDLFGEVMNHAGGVLDESESAGPEKSVDSEKADSPAESENLPDKSDDAALRAGWTAIKGGKYLYSGTVSPDGKRSGKGRTASPEGIMLYEGGYRDDMRHGFGISRYKNGSINYVGDWENNARSGCGTGYRLSDGVLHTGFWRGNAPDGCGARFTQNGEFIELSHYSAGVKHGKSVCFDEKGRVVISVWNNGEKVSEKIIED